MTTVEICFAEFGESRFNNGDASLPLDRLEPSLSSFRKYFPEASFVVYTDQLWEERDGVTVRKVESPFAPHPRKGNRNNDYFQPFGLLESKADISIAIDSDLLIVNPDVRAIIPLTEKFGCCAPIGGRSILWRDARSTCDGGFVADQSKGCGLAHCTAFMSLRRDHTTGKFLMQAYCDQLIEDAKLNRGARGPLSLWRASWKTGIAPYTLPREWTLTGSNLGDSFVGDRVLPIVLHYGHESVQRHYAALIASENEIQTTKLSGLRRRSDEYGTEHGSNSA